jgi:hypothetical protein
MYFLYFLWVKKKSTKVKDFFCTIEIIVPKWDVLYYIIENTMFSHSWGNIKLEFWKASKNAYIVEHISPAFLYLINQ